MRLGAALAAVNVLVFAAMLAAKPAEYHLIDKRGGSSADPLYLAARPFYSSFHSPNVPVYEEPYFLLNFPAMFMAFELPSIVDEIVYAAGWPMIGGARRSWIMAITFGVSAAVQAFMIGALIGQWRSRRERVDEE